MGFLDRLMGGQNDIPAAWKELTDVAQLEVLEQLSFSQPVVIFKHSTTCGISASAKFRLESGLEHSDEKIAFYYLDLLGHRNLSNEIADRYGVIHQSPQLIVLSHGKAVSSTSHHQISQQWLEEAVENVRG